VRRHDKGVRERNLKLRDLSAYRQATHTAPHVRMPLAQLASQAWAARAAKKYCGAVRRLAALPCASLPVVKDHPRQARGADERRPSRRKHWHRAHVAIGVSRVVDLTPTALRLLEAQ